MHTVIRLYVLFIIACLATSMQAAVNIHGQVTQETNEPLEFVTVRISGTAIGAMSGLDGKYSLSCPEADTIKVVFSCIGYEEATRRLIDIKGDVTLNVKMSPKSYTLQGVEVTEIKKQTSQMQEVDINDYKLAPNVSGGVESMITTMAGVTSGNEMSSQYSVRGGSYDENSVVINGIEVYRPQLVTSGQQEGLSIINPDLVGNVSFSTGGFPARYGDRMSSALDITYREPESFEGSADVSLMGVNAAIGISTKKLSMLHGVRYKSNASLLSSMEDKGEYDPRFFDYQTSINFKISQKWKAMVLGNIAINDYRFTPASRETSFGTSTDAKKFKVYFDGQEKDRFETFFGAAGLTYSPNRANEFTFLASGYLTNELVAYDISGEYWLDQAGTSGSNNNTIVGGELGVGKYHEHARNRLKASVMAFALRGASGINSHTLNYGIQFNHESITDRSRQWELHDSAGYSVPLDPNALKVIYNSYSDNEVASNRFSAYAQDTYRMHALSGFLNINAGVRLSYWTFNKELLLSPRINIGYVPDAAPRWSFRFATGLYYQSPFFKEYRMPVDDGEGNTVLQLNSDIKSQRSWQFILGSDYTFRAMERPFKLSAETYYKALSNLIPYEVDNLDVIYSGVNSSSGYAMGLDMKLFGQFVAGSDSWISFSLMKTQENLNGVKVPRPTDRRYSVAIFFTDYFPKIPKLKFSLRGIFSDGLPTTAPRSTRDIAWFRAPAYKRVDVGFSYGLITSNIESPRRQGIKNMWLGLDVFNLLDISNVSSYYWVTDVNGIQYAVPNYLTRRQLNIRLSIDF